MASIGQPSTKRHKPNEGCVTSIPLSWDSLPRSVLERILTGVWKRDISECARVCRGWDQLFRDDSFWRSLINAHYGVPAAYRTNSTFPPRTGTFREYFILCYQFEQEIDDEIDRVCYPPNPNRLMYNYGKQDAHPDKVTHCDFSPSGRYIVAIEGDSRKLSLIDVKDKLRLRVLLDNYPPIEMEDFDEQLFLKLFDLRYKNLPEFEGVPTFNRTEEFLMIGQDGSHKDPSRRQIVIFGAPEWNVVRRITLPDGFTKLLWLGDYTILQTLKDRVSFWSVTADRVGHSTGQILEYHGADLMIVNNRRSGWKELISWGNGTIAKQSITGHGHEPAHRCDSCTHRGAFSPVRRACAEIFANCNATGCVIADYSSENANLFSLSVIVTKAAVQGKILGVGTTEDRLFVNLEEASGAKILLEMDFFFNKLRQIPLLLLLDPRKLDLYCDESCESDGCSDSGDSEECLGRDDRSVITNSVDFLGTTPDGMCLFSTTRKCRCITASRLSVWDPVSDVMLHNNNMPCSSKWGWRVLWKPYFKPIYLLVDRYTSICVDSKRSLKKAINKKPPPKNRRAFFWKRRSAESKAQK